MGLNEGAHSRGQGEVRPLAALALLTRTNLRLLAAHLRAFNSSRSEVYRESRQKKYEAFVGECTLHTRLQDLTARRRDWQNSPWAPDDEKEYLKLCKMFDQCNLDDQGK